MKIIKFHSHNFFNKNLKEEFPTMARSLMPKWFSSANAYWIDENNVVFDGEDGRPKLPSFKQCPALFDVFSTGYMLTTPCDIDFQKQGDNLVPVIQEKAFINFCGARAPMGEFVVPDGYMDQHFHWYPNWGIGLPDGYSALCLSPINRYDLPFLTVNGIIDSDKLNTPGLVPFFIKKGFSGIIKAGTPYMQIIPFKREDWKMENIFYSQDEIISRHQHQAAALRESESAFYRKFLWQRKGFK